MHVMILAPDTPESGKNMGGLGEHVRQILPRFSKDIELYVLYPRGTAHDAGNIHYRPLDIPPSGFPANPKVPMDDGFNSTYLAQQFYVSTAWGLPKPDVVVSMDWSTASAGMTIAHAVKAKFMLSVHLSPVDASGMDVFTDSFFSVNGYQALNVELQALQYAHRVVHVTKAYMEKDFHMHGLPQYGYRQFADKTIIAPNGVNREQFQHLEPIALPGNRKYKALFVGRFAKMKNIEALLGAKLPKNVDLCFIGGGRGSQSNLTHMVIEAAQTREEVHYLNMETEPETGQIRYKPINGREKDRYIASADFIIIPSVNEPFNIVALEALAAGTVLLSSYSDGMGDFLTEDAVIPCGTTPNSIAKALKQAAAMSKKERQHRIDRGLALCKTYTWENTAHILEDCFYELLQETDRTVPGKQAAKQKIQQQAI